MRRRVVVIVAIAAHPEDQERLCAGALAMASSCGAEVRLLLLTAGQHGSADPWKNTPAAAASLIARHPGAVLPAPAAVHACCAPSVTPRGLLVLALLTAVAGPLLIAMLHGPGAGPSRIYDGTDTRRALAAPCALG